MDELLFTLNLVAALGCGLVAGIFFAFSNFVMKALARIHAGSGIAAMQSINVVVLNPLFLGLFIGTAVICLLLAIYSLLRWQSPATVWLLAGSALYIIGTFIVTIAFNVPRNETLARVDASHPEAIRVWRNYVAGWTRWNHVRTIAAVAAAAFFTIAL